VTLTRLLLGCVGVAAVVAAGYAVAALGAELARDPISL
jgi:hypothetical protein